MASNYSKPRGQLGRRHRSPGTNVRHNLAQPTTPIVTESKASRVNGLCKKWASANKFEPSTRLFADFESGPETNPRLIAD